MSSFYGSQWSFEAKVTFAVPPSRIQPEAFYVEGAHAFPIRLHRIYICVMVVSHNLCALYTLYSTALPTNNLALTMRRNVMLLLLTNKSPPTEGWIVCVFFFHVTAPRDPTPYDLCVMIPCILDKAGYANKMRTQFYWFNLRLASSGFGCYVANKSYGFSGTCLIVDKNNQSISSQPAGCCSPADEKTKCVLGSLSGIFTHNVGSTWFFKLLYTKT